MNTVKLIADEKNSILNKIYVLLEEKKHLKTKVVYHKNREFHKIIFFQTRASGI